MLVLHRKVGESVFIDAEHKVTVVEIRGKSVRLGFDCPPDVKVLREEIKEQDERGR